MAAVELEVRESIAILTINRPDKRNAINAEVAALLDDAFTMVRDSRTIRAAVLTGAGDKAFCAGADLQELIPLAAGARPAVTHWDHRAIEIAKRGAFLGRRDPVKPVIAAVNGDAMGAGMELLLGTDVRIAVADARFAFPESRWGLFPTGGCTVRLPVQIPFVHAMELMLTAEPIGADRAARVGLVNQVVPREELLERAIQVATCIAENAPLAVQAIRRSLRECLGRPQSEALDMEARLAAPIFRTHDAIEGPQAFSEKRSPRFRGE